MNQRSYPLVEVHYALWAVLTVPLGFAGLFFLVPGLIFEIGVPLEVVAALLIVYIYNLTNHRRAAWLFGLFFHGLLIAGSAFYLPRIPLLLGVPLLLANIYSVGVLLVYRNLWAGSVRRSGQALPA